MSKVVFTKLYPGNEWVRAVALMPALVTLLKCLLRGSNVAKS